MLTVASLVSDCGLELRRGRGERRPAAALGPHLRARGSDPVALGRGAPADHRLQPRHPGQAARLRGTARCERRGRPWLRRRLRPQAVARRRSWTRPAGRHAPVRGAVRDAVHRDHRAGGGASRQRAVRRARAWDEGSRAPRAPRDRWRRARRDHGARGGAPSAGRRSSSTAPAPVARHPAAGACSAEDARRDRGRAGRTGGRRGRTPSSPKQPATGPWRCRCPGRTGPRLRAGSSWSPTTGRWATSSA